jgi:hypothetical protein
MYKFGYCGNMDDVYSLFFIYIIMMFIIYGAQIFFFELGAFQH